MATKTKKPKPEWTDAERAEMTRKIGECEDRARVHETEMERLRKQFKASKEKFNGEVSEQRQLIFEMNHPEALPLFTTNGKADKPKDDDAPTAAPEGDMMQTPLREALPGLAKKFYELCEKQQIDTIGKLFDWKNAKEDRWWRDLGKGIGKALVEKLDNAIEKFTEEMNKAALANAAAEEIGKEHPELQPVVGDGQAETPAPEAAEQQPEGSAA